MQTEAKKQTLAIAIGNGVNQIFIWLNDDGTYDFVKKYLSNGKLKTLERDLDKTTAYLLYKDFIQRGID